MAGPLVNPFSGKHNCNVHRVTSDENKYSICIYMLPFHMCRQRLTSLPLLACVNIRLEISDVLCICYCFSCGLLFRDTIKHCGCGNKGNGMVPEHEL